MGEQIKKSVLMVDDDASFSTGVAGLLGLRGYSVQSVASVDDAIEWRSSNATPDFVLADRQLYGRHIEEGELERLCNAFPEAFVVIYTQREELTEQETLSICAKGAIRVLDRKHAVFFVNDVDLLVREFEELVQIRDELGKEAGERSKIVAALIGTDVALTVIDRHFHCWYANPRQEYLAGRVAHNGLCWNLFHDHPVCAGACWGCTVNEIFESDVRAVERLFLSRYANGVVRWVSVRSTPIRLNEEGEVIAVREGVIEADEKTINSLDRSVRLLRIAQGLIHVGFGRARIYERREDVMELVAAAARTDDPKSPASAYMESLGNYSFDPSDSKYTMFGRRDEGQLFTSMSSRKRPDRHAEALELEAPFLVVPIRSEQHVLACIELDFLTLPALLRKEMIASHAKRETLQWVQEQYGREVLKAISPSSSDPAQQMREQLLQRTQLRVGAARRVSQAIKSLQESFEELLPSCRVSVRILADDRGELVERDDLCAGPRDPKVPSGFCLDDRVSLAARAMKLRRPIWVDDYRRYRAEAAAKALPRGFCSASTRSTAHLPLRVENRLYGTMSIDSPHRKLWEKHGYQEPLRRLAHLTTLVVRDLSLAGQIEAATAERAALLHKERDNWRKFAAAFQHHVGNPLHGLEFIRLVLEEAERNPSLTVRQRREHLQLVLRGLTSARSIISTLDSLVRRETPVGVVDLWHCFRQAEVAYLLNYWRTRGIVPAITRAFVPVNFSVSPADFQPIGIGTMIQFCVTELLINAARYNLELPGVTEHGEPVYSTIAGWSPYWGTKKEPKAFLDKLTGFRGSVKFDTEGSLDEDRRLILESALREESSRKLRASRMQWDGEADEMHATGPSRLDVSYRVPPSGGVSYTLQLDEERVGCLSLPFSIDVRVSESVTERTFRAAERLGWQVDLSEYYELEVAAPRPKNSLIIVRSSASSPEKVVGLQGAVDHACTDLRTQGIGMFSLNFCLQNFCNEDPKRFPSTSLFLCDDFGEYDDLALVTDYRRVSTACVFPKSPQQWGLLT